MNESMFYAEILVILLEAHIEICLAGAIMMQVPERHNQDNNLLMWSLGGIFLLMTTVLFPVLFIWLLMKKLSYLKTQNYLKRFGVLTDGIKIHSKWHAVFYFFFILRRIVYVLVYFLLSNYPTFQIQIISFCNLAQLIYLGNVKPLDSVLRNRLELSNEYFIISCCFI